MFVLGLILIFLAAGALIAAVAGGANDQTQFLNIDMSAMSVFLLGAATLLVFVCGLELARSGVKRAHRRRKETKELTRRAARAEKHQDNDDPGDNRDHENDTEAR